MSAEPGRTTRPPERLRALHRSRAAALALALGLAWACAGAPDARAPAAPPASPPGDGLVVRLVFGEAADLDLFVTDPLQETVYFGNTPTRAGGALDRDLRCDAPAPRVETVTFEAPPPGRYRVGVDHPRRCNGGRDPAPFAVEVLVDGRELARERNEIPLGRFEPVVLEFEIPAPPAP